MHGLKSFLFFNELSQLEVAEYLGISKVQMSKLVSGIAPFRNELFLKLLNNDKGWNTEFITDSTWSDLEAGKYKDGVKKLVSAKPEHAIPLIPFEAVAGPGDPVYEDERIEDYYTVSEFKDSDFLIRVKGDSMTPRYTGGDLLACKKIPITEVYFFQYGRCYVILTRSQGAMVKRIQPSEKDGWIKCVSDNVKYAPFDVPMDDIVSVALVNGSISLE